MVSCGIMVLQLPRQVRLVFSQTWEYQMASKAVFPPRLRVMAEYGSSGIWVAESVGPFRHGMISHQRLGLPHELKVRFVAWIEQYWARADQRPLDVAAFNAEGRSLAISLKAFVGGATEVVFEPEAEDGGLGGPEVIERADPLYDLEGE
jgi:hypothetical protein